MFVGGEGPFTRQLADAGVPFSPLRGLVRPIAPLTDLRGLAELRDQLRRFAPDLLSSHSTKAGWLGRAVGRNLGVPTVFTAHGWPLSPGPLAPARRVVQLAEQAAASVSQALILVSDYDRRVAVEHRIGLPHQHAVVHNALPDVGPQRRATASSEPPRVVMVARLERPKDPRLAIEALASLRELPWTFELIGDGPLRPELEARIQAHELGARVHLLGVRDDVPARLAQAHVFLLASRREGLPLSVLEAMRAGLPVVSTDAGGVCEAVQHETTGFVTPRDDVAALSQALRRLLQSPSLRTEMGAAGRERFEAEFSFPLHLRRIWAVYARAIEEGEEG